MNIAVIEHRNEKGAGPREETGPHAGGTNPARYINQAKDTTAMALSEDHTSYLISQGIAPEYLAGAVRSGSVRTDNRDDRRGIVFRWDAGDGTQAVDQFRADEPGQYPDGTDYPKYKTATGVDFPLWRTREGAPGAPVLLVEGTKQAMSAAGYAPEGWSVFAVAGCGNWNVKSLQALAPKGRSVVVVLDADMATNADVWGMADVLRVNLTAYPGTDVRFARIPSKKVSDTTGLDDYLAEFPHADRPDMLRGLVEAATAKLPRKPSTRKNGTSEADAIGKADSDALVLPGPDSPMDCAREIAKRYLDDEGNPTLINRDGVWYIYEGAHWSELTETQISSELSNVTGDAVCVALDRNGMAVMTDMGKPKLVPWNPNRNRVADLRSMLQAVLDQSREFGTEVIDRVWISRKGAPSLSGGHVMSFANGLLDLATRKLYPHTAAYFNLSSVPYDYVPDAAAPSEWLRFLDSVWKEDAESKALLQEWFGYVLSGRTDLHAMMLLLGPRRSGKSVMMSVLEGLVGEANNVGLTMGGLARNFGLQHAVGKLSGVIGDARMQPQDRIPIMEKILAISGEDAITIDRKNRVPWDGRMSVRFTVLSNRIPDFPDESGAVAARWQTLTTHESFEGREDRGILGRCMDELSGILLWALDGLDRVSAAGQFTSPSASREVVEISNRQAAPVSAFLADWCDADAHGEELKSDVYDAYRAWCAAEGVEHPMILSKFAAAMFETGAGVRSRRVRRNGVQVQVFQGVRLRASLVAGAGWSAPSEAVDAEPQPDPVEPSGVVTPCEAGEDVESDGIPRLADQVPVPVSVSQTSAEGFSLTASAGGDEDPFACDPWATGFDS